MIRWFLFICLFWIGFIAVIKLERATIYFDLIRWSIIIVINMLYWKIYIKYYK